MTENKTAKTPTDDGHVAWACQCGKLYTVTCISSKPSKQWVGLTAYEIQEIHSGNQHWGDFACAIEAKLREKNHG